MDDTRTPVGSSLRGARIAPGGGTGSRRVSAAVASTGVASTGVASTGVASTGGESPDLRIELFQSPAAVPERRPSLAGAASKTANEHVVGGARVSEGGAHVVLPIAGGTAVGTSVALADGTSITFQSVRGVPELEVA